MKKRSVAATDLHVPATVAVGSFLPAGLHGRGASGVATARVYEGDKHEGGNRHLN